MTAILSDEQVERFVTDGYVHLPEAFPRELADECRAFLWRETGLDPADPAGWTEPVVRLGGYGGELFTRAATTPRLHGAFDQLVGAGRWVPRTGLGTFPIRFPHPGEAGDTGWHLDGSFTPEGEQGHWLNLRSRGRALLMLFLFSDTGADDAPTRIKVGSHLDVPPFLEPLGERGTDLFSLCTTMQEAGRLDAPDRPLALATGRAGDVYLCHPFLIHAAQDHHGTTPRFLAQPPLLPTGLLDLERPDGDCSPVERAVRLGLARQA
ncbi:phytanoyl-CoA dioxygenase family protein [Kitasatospora sp. NBC_01250]|uniref:phytanoyl-CoA dioxygenase family protein n=1 Tax=unclassified Kitasatospora TaxID=2633591 RepID=UPI002E13751A|nr:MULTISPECIES: phytanoyl-CoA dioxygenase family protein [unclassified Kitasatospora]WSJ67596.1 phytanoyl-CoA dioxygenase family protein [Kitasatospora sp. NBC_01302]